MHIDLSEDDSLIIKLGSLVSIAVFPHTVLYSPYGESAIVQDYIAYGFEEIEHFYKRTNYMFENKGELTRSIEEPFLGIVVAIDQRRSSPGPYIKQEVKMFCKVYLTYEKRQYWFRIKDLEIYHG